MKNKTQIQPAKGKLGVLIPGINGAVATTLIAGTLAVRRGLAQPIGSLTQMGTIRLGKRSENRFPMIKEFVPLADLSDIVFGGWDIRNEDCYTSAQYAKVLQDKDIVQIADELKSLRPMKAVFDQRYVKRLEGTWVKTGTTKFDLAMQLRDDIRSFKVKNNLDRVIVLWCGSTETFIPVQDVHKDIKKFEQAMKSNHDAISPSMLLRVCGNFRTCSVHQRRAESCQRLPGIRKTCNLYRRSNCRQRFQNRTNADQNSYSTNVESTDDRIERLVLNEYFGNRDGEVFRRSGIIQELKKKANFQF